MVAEISHEGGITAKAFLASLFCNLPYLSPLTHSLGRKTNKQTNKQRLAFDTDGTAM